MDRRYTQMHADKSQHKRAFVLSACICVYLRSIILKSDFPVHPVIPSEAPSLPKGNIEMKKSVFTIALTAAAIAFAAKNPMVGGNEMFPTKTIVDNAVNSADHTTLVAAVKAAGLVDTLKGPGPFTVFAPTNAAFSKLPAGTVDTLLKPENKGQLVKVLTYHVVPGRMTASDIASNAAAHGGKATLTTVEGE